MTTELLLGLAVRLLPAVALVALSFVAVADARTRTQWTNLLYQAGSLRPSQRDDPKVQRGVRIPFLVAAFIFLIWPVRYYLHATNTVEVTASLYGSNRNAAPGDSPQAPAPPAETASQPATAPAPLEAPPLAAPPLVPPSSPGSPPAPPASAPAPGAPFSPYGNQPR